MGRIARNLIAAMRQDRRDTAEAARHFAEGIPEELPSPEQLVEEGYDPQHVLYIMVQNFASMFSESISEAAEFDPYVEIVEEAEDQYLPSSPPMSPITGSFFYTWALFDLRFGPDGETMGGCLLDILRAMGAPPDMRTALKNYSESRMGIYEHRGKRGGHVRLRELITGDELLCHSTSGYQGREGELWYVRLCPPLADNYDYHVAVTTPYILTGASIEDWTDYLEKQIAVVESEARAAGESEEEADSSCPAARRQALRELFKYGEPDVDWMEFVFQAYQDFQGDAIFLTGIPDDPASLPHAPLNPEARSLGAPRESSRAVAASFDQELLRVKFTEAQRKAIAEMCPEFSGRLKLSKKNQRVVDLSEGELERVVAAARDALATAPGPRRVALKNIIAHGATALADAKGP